jgi:hypothetical protein
MSTPARVGVSAARRAFEAVVRGGGLIGGISSVTITCADGFSFSIARGEFAYCVPRNDEGPYTMVEIGFPSERPEPWDAWRERCETPSDPTETVYPFVPVALVSELIRYHETVDA